jgi:methyl-accepting chemotaxis protein
VSTMSTTLAATIEEQAATTSEITVNVNDAARGAGSIASSIAGVANAAHQASGGAQETQVAAEGLSSVASTLTTVVERFRF